MQAARREIKGAAERPSAQQPDDDQASRDDEGKRLSSELESVPAEGEMTL